MSATWEDEHKTAELWGLGKGRSSSDSAYDHNLEAEVAYLVGEGAVTIMLDMWKAFETINPSILMDEARAVGYPMRLAAMLLLSYREPRLIKAFGSVSVAVVSEQGNIAGCSHATTLLSVLFYRALRRSTQWHPRFGPEVWWTISRCSGRATTRSKLRSS